MSYQVQKNSNTGEPEIVIAGWNDGISDSPYTNKGITRMLNLNNHYYPGALYPNYSRTSATSATIGTPMPYLFTSTNPSGNSETSIGNNNFIAMQYIIADLGGKTWAASTRGTWGAFNTHTIPSNIPNSITGICYFSPTFNNNSGAGNLWCFAWGMSITEDYQTMYYSEFSGSWGAWQECPFWGSALYPVIITQGTPNYAIWASNNIMYICNGPYISTLQQGASDFNPGGSATTDYIFQQAGIVLPFYENAIWLSEWNGNILAVSGNRIYVWNEATAAVSAQYFIQCPEPISKTIVINNIIYIFAGHKGNIYVSNGYSCDLLKKIPDSFFGQIDPTLYWGGIMYHRNRLWFGLTSSTITGSSGYISGIFSLAINTGPYTFETPGALTFDNQNSFGLYQTNQPVDTTSNPVILFDDNGAGQDFYYSVWNNNSIVGIDKSATTPYEAGETFIETDMIPVGTYLNKTTPINVEFKLDAPMTSGDSITVYGRKNFNDAYSQFDAVFTSTGTEVGWVFKTNIRGAQWLQLKVVLTFAGGDFAKITEVRLRNSV